MASGLPDAGVLNQDLTTTLFLGDTILALISVLDFHYRRVPFIWTQEMELRILITVEITETQQKKNEFLILVALKVTVFSQNGQV